MPLFLLEWKLATEVAVFSGKLVAVADDEAHAIERARSSLGKEGALAVFSAARVGNVVYEISRKEKMTDWVPSSPVPGDTDRTGQMFAFDIGARANVIASSEKVAMTRFGFALRDGAADGKYCTLLKVSVLDREMISRMSERERFMLGTSFKKVSGGGASPR